MRINNFTSVFQFYVRLDFLSLCCHCFLRKRAAKETSEVLRTTILVNGRVSSAIITEYLSNNTEFVRFNLTDFEVTRFGKHEIFCLASKDS